MSRNTTPHRPLYNDFSVNSTTPRDQSYRIRFRSDGSLEPDPNPITLTSPMRTPDRPQIMTDNDLDRKLTSVLNRFFSIINSESIFRRTLGKLALETQIDILGDNDGWNYLQGARLSRDRKQSLLNLYSVYDKKMQYVLKQSGI